ncbi:MAG: carbohydrate binding family 9 domain-containing protein, partial [Gemmatimonadota bacterium]|nr:carbohydrate binding family 9 domain-containing protein [Gemmatimonadota bacterium]
MGARSNIFLCVATLATAHAAAAQTTAAPAARADTSARLNKSVTAARISNGSVRLDGKLDEAIWANVPATTDFLQKQPVEGAAPSDQLEIRLAYDDDALYVGTRVRTRDRRPIQAAISRRDAVAQSEHIQVSLDTYHDKRTAYTFVITASGVRADWYHPSDNEQNRDNSFDPVWTANAAVDSTGWTAEMRIPFSQLRFTRADSHVWGVNFDHWVPTRNEDVFWIPVPRNVRGWSSWFGELRGISGVQPTRRLEILPYVATGAKLNADRHPRNPFDNGVNLTPRVGADMKMGVGPNLTLQATVNPDFGQVEADPAEVNLSAFETFFSEKRPFFLEGSQLLPGYFYSRRVGARPRGPASSHFVDYPDNSTILGAAKLTGRLRSGTSIGSLLAVTNREHAQLYDTTTNDFSRTVVAPLTAYGAGRVQREFGRNASVASASLTAVERWLDDDGSLARLLNRRAYAGATDVVLRLADRTYEVAARIGFSQIQGDTSAILLAQRSSARYFQRPDATSYHVDPTRTSLTGLNSFVEVQKTGGGHWRGYAFLGTESPGFELNDAGRLGTADGINAVGQIRYIETGPRSRLLRQYSVSMSHENEWNYDRNRQFGAIRSDASLEFRNFWTLNVTAWHDVNSLDARLTRGGPLMGTPTSNVGIIQLSNAAGANTRLSARIYHGVNQFGAPTTRYSGGITYRPTPRWQLSVDPNYLHSVNARQYITTRASGRAETYDRRYIFSWIDQDIFQMNLRANYTFKPDLTLEVYAQPFAASGRYYDFGELPAPRVLELRYYGTDGTAATKNADGS